MNFLPKEFVVKVQKVNIDRFGGSHGLRDEGAFDSALSAAETRHYYENCDAVTCAATYGFHLCQAHAFVDGNKRIGAACALLCLEINGVQHDLDQLQLADAFLRVASSEMTRDELETFLRAHVR